MNLRGLEHSKPVHSGSADQVFQFSSTVTRLRLDHDRGGAGAEGRKHEIETYDTIVAGPAEIHLRLESGADYLDGDDRPSLVLALVQDLDSKPDALTGDEGGRGDHFQIEPPLLGAPFQVV